METESFVSVTARLKVELDKTSSWSAGSQHTQPVSQWHQKEENKDKKDDAFSDLAGAEIAQLADEILCSA